MIKTKGSKNQNNVKRFICLVMAMLFMVSKTVYADDVTVEAMDKTVYFNYSVDQVCAEYKENAYRASNKYEDFYIGLIGSIESISSNGKQITLKSSDSGMSFPCDCSKKQVKVQLESLTSGDNVIICGIVKKHEETEFKVKADRIITIGDIKSYENGYTTSDGTVFLCDDVEQYRIGNNTCFVQKQWKEQLSDEFWNRYIEDVFDQKSGMVVQFGDDENSELLGIYAFSWSEIYEKASQDKSKGFFKSEKAFVEQYLLEKLVNKIMKYELGPLNTIKSTKTDNVTFDYYYGTKESSGNNIHAEVFFIRNDDELVAITYQFENEPQHLAEVVLMLGTYSQTEN
ncbi:MAG: hypothetical protein K6G87_01710 [Butyrivibrio sp.]|uniref:OB-fold protein n=1 Tax=Butyrivibrio sp. TaxID=28121 RepID=UPI0025E94538|nr:hypothetical protein [Butyrivibrio sp.]MCR5769931.1 hypothetical protein [Butyrivibrio sp.]